MKLPESSPEKKELDKLIIKLKIIENTKPSTNPAMLKMKLEIASDFLKDFGEDLSENMIVKFIKCIDIAVDPISYKPKDNKNKEFIGLCAETRIYLTSLGAHLEQPSYLQQKIYELIKNLDLIITGSKFDTAILETNHSVNKLTGFFTGLLIDKNDEELKKRIRSSLETAFYDFYGIETEGNSQESTENILERLSKAYQTLSFLRELIRRNASPN